jgi:hypothetical protein
MVGFSHNTNLLWYRPRFTYINNSHPYPKSLLVVMWLLFIAFVSTVVSGGVSEVIGKKADLNPLKTDR